MRFLRNRIRVRRPQPSPARLSPAQTIDGGILERSSRQFGVGDAELFGLLSEQLAGGEGAPVQQRRQAFAQSRFARALISANKNDAGMGQRASAVAAVILIEIGRAHV